MSGGLEWMPCCRIELRDVHSVRNHRSHQWRLCCTPGNGLNVPGPGCMLTLLGLLKATCSWYWLMPTLSGWKCIQWRKRHLWSLSKSWELYLQPIVFRRCWSRIMVQWLPLLSFMILLVVMPSVMLPRHHTIHHPTVWRSRLFKHSNQPWRGRHLAPWKLEWPSSCSITINATFVYWAFAHQATTGLMPWGPCWIP